MLEGLESFMIRESSAKINKEIGLVKAEKVQSSFPLPYDDDVFLNKPFVKLSFSIRIR